MLVLNLVFSIFSAYVIGSVLLELIYLGPCREYLEPYRGTDIILFIPVRYFLGLYFIILYMMALSILGISFSYSSFYILSLAFLGLYLFFVSKRYLVRPQTESVRISNTGKPDQIYITRSGIKKAIAIILVFLIVANILLVFFFAYLFPVKFWDAISSYSLKGRAFFLDGDIFTFFKDHDYSFSHYSYPLFLPLVHTWTYQWMDMASGQGILYEGPAKTVFPVFYIALLMVLTGLFLKRFSYWLSLLFTFVFSALPVIIDHGYIEYNNLVFSCVLLLACYFFYRWLSEDDKRSLLLSAVFFGLLLNIRSEGIIYCLLFLIINIIHISSAKRIKGLGGKGIRSLSFFVAVSMAIIAISWLPWFLIRQELQIGLLSMEWQGILTQGAKSLTFDWSLASRSLFAQLFFNAYDSTRAYFGSSYGPAWVILSILFFINPKGCFKEYNWVYFCFIALGFLAVFISLGFVWEFSWSTERYVLSFFPLSYYWVLKSLRV